MSRQFLMSLNALTNPTRIQQGSFHFEARYKTHDDSDVYYVKSRSAFCYIHLEPQGSRRLNSEEALSTLEKSIKGSFNPNFLSALFDKLLQETHSLIDDSEKGWINKEINYKCAVHSVNDGNIFRGEKPQEEAQLAANEALKKMSKKLDKSKSPRTYFEELLTEVCNKICRNENARQAMDKALFAYTSENNGSIWHEIIPKLADNNVSRIQSFIEYLSGNEGLHHVYRESLKRRDNVGNNLMHIAAAEGKLQLLINLLARMKFINQDWIQARLCEANGQGLTPWHVMIQKKCEETLFFSESELQPDKSVLDSKIPDSTQDLQGFSLRYATRSMQARVDQWVQADEASLASELVRQAIPVDDEEKKPKKTRLNPESLVAAAISGDESRVKEIIKANEAFLIPAICEHQLLQVASKQDNRLVLATVMAAMRRDTFIETGRNCVFHSLPPQFQSQKRFTVPLLFGRLIRELNDPRYKKHLKAKASRVEELKNLLSHYSDSKTAQPTTPKNVFKLTNPLIFTKFKALGIMLGFALNGMTTYQEKRDNLAGFMLSQLSSLSNPIQTATVVDDPEQDKWSSDQQASFGGGGAAAASY
jgi:hypothetical protein